MVFIGAEIARITLPMSRKTENTKEIGDREKKLLKFERKNSNNLVFNP